MTRKENSLQSLQVCCERYPIRASAGSRIHGPAIRRRKFSSLSSLQYRMTIETRSICVMSLLWTPPGAAGGVGRVGAASDKSGDVRIMHVRSCFSVARVVFSHFYCHLWCVILLTKDPVIDLNIFSAMNRGIIRNRNHPGPQFGKHLLLQERQIYLLCDTSLKDNIIHPSMVIAGKTLQSQIRSRTPSRERPQPAFYNDSRTVYIPNSSHSGFNR